MPPTSSASNSTTSHSDPASAGAARDALRLHVLITPTDDRRALFSSLAALSAAREPRLEVTAVAAPGTRPAIGLDKRFRFLPESRDLLDDPIEALGIKPGSVLFILRAGALPPRGWVETMLETGKLPSVRAVAAHGWSPNPERSAEVELLRWEKEEHLARRNCYRVVEDRADLEAPMIAIFRPTELASEITDFVRGHGTESLCLRPEGTQTVERLLVAKDLVVWQDPQAPPLSARVICGGPEIRKITSLDEAEALEARLHAALEDGPRPEISLRLARLGLSRGDRLTAIRHARICLDAWPECAEAKLYVARAQTGEGRLAAARHMIEDLLHAGPLRLEDRASVFACLASIWLHSGEPAQAQPCLDVALSIAPDNPLARYCQARIALAAGRFGEALEHLETCLAAVPLSPDMHFELGRTRVLAGLEPAGLESLARALELNPDHKKAEALLARLAPPR